MGTSGTPPPAKSHRRSRQGTMTEGNAAPSPPPPAEEVRRQRAVTGRFAITYAPAPLEGPRWRVEGSSGQTYMVRVPAFPRREGASCNCRDFLNRRVGTCKHLEATLAYAAVHPPAPTPAAAAGNDLPDLEATLAAHETLVEASRESLASGDFSRVLQKLRREGRRIFQRPGSARRLPAGPPS